MIQHSCSARVQWPRLAEPGNRWISRIGSLRFWWNSVQRKALMRTMCRREIFTKKCRQQQIIDSDLKGAWHYNHVTFTPIVKNFMLYCRLIYMLSILCVRLTIKVKLGIPESFKVGWYPPKKTGSSHLKKHAIFSYCTFINMQTQKFKGQVCQPLQQTLQKT